MAQSKKAIVLLSGGIDSTVSLALALERGRDCHCISFDYGQRHRIELDAAVAIASHYGVTQQLIAIDPSALTGSALVSNCDIAKNRTAEEIAEGGIPSTYVPARNTLFLAYAAAQAEIRDADEIYYGPNAMDAKPYPDCRPAYVQAFQSVLNTASQQAVEGTPPLLVTPLLEWDKTRIVAEGVRLGVPFHLTFTCYSPSDMGVPCGSCDACVLRNAALEEAGVTEAPV